MSQQSDHDQARLDRLRRYRSRPAQDDSLAFMADYFARTVEKPYAQLGELAERWPTLIPVHLHAHTALVSLQRGVLRVAVDSAATGYELDRLLRAGLRQQLIRACRQRPIRSVRVEIDASIGPDVADANGPGPGTDFPPDG